MGRFDGTLLASDMDGTLLNDAHELSAENTEAIRYFTENGGVFTIATGRMLPAINLYIWQLSINAPIIALNGAAVFDIKKEALLHSRPHDADLVKIVDSLAEDFPELGVEVVMLDRMYICRGSEVSRRHCEIIKEPYILTDVRMASGDCMKMNLTQAPDYLDDVERYMDTKYPGEFHIAHSAAHYLEVLHPDANKGRGLDVVAGIMKIAREHIYAVGDNHNDAELLERAAVSFAPASAVQRIREAADVVVSSNNEHAIRDVVAHLDRLYG